MTILLTGGTGRLGSEVRTLIPDLIAPTLAELDLTHASSIH